MSLRGKKRHRLWFCFYGFNISILSGLIAELAGPVGEYFLFTLAEAGQVLDLSDGTRLEVLAVTRRGIVLLLTWRSFRPLLPVGLDLETMDALQADPSLIGVTALLLPESGYAPLSPPEWIRQLNPQGG